ncbi:hypothetical protein [Psychroserpens sp.]|uniref:hypothetical protein n=1 Tax=Psychroserpens sp. TaxID=2020870 RepID=UPI00385D3E50
MKTKLFFSFFLLVTTIHFSFSQTEAEIRYAQESYKEKAEEVKTQLISDICSELKLDAFENQIVSQSIRSYFDEVQRVYISNHTNLEKRELLELVDKNHFNDLKTILKPEEITFILNQIKGDWKKNQKKLKKKRKKKKREKN